MPSLTNQLDSSNSLYLQQHARNPVHWQLWSDDLFLSNSPSHKLCIISIGYSSCHWCHVMEEESFEDQEVADLMNSHFISIKVDRETRPDIDARYMNALQLMTGTGGWPLNIIALPDGTPIYGGTYFSKRDWTAALEQVAQLWKEEPQQVLDYGAQMQSGLRDMLEVSLTTRQNTFKAEDFEDVAAYWMRTIDPVHGGPNGAPKFPLPSNYSFLLDYALQSNNREILDYCLLSLEKMALGGIYDWLHGGITRYSTDRFWKVPHFEKMLYDNAQMMGLYAKAYRTSQNELFLQTAQSISAFIEAEMKLDNGLYASALDADSPTPESQREEGGYYTWSEDELASFRIIERAKFDDYFDITPYSSWEGKYILHRIKSIQDWAMVWNISVEDAKALERSWRKTLLEKSAARTPSHPKPIRDPKAISSWNALLVLGWFELSLADPKSDSGEKAMALLKSITENLLAEDIVLHEHKGQKGYLDDFATIGLAMLKGYALSGQESYASIAIKIADQIGSEFAHPKNTFYRFTSESREDWQVVLEIEDNVIPSANSFVAHFFYELGTYTGQQKWIEKSKAMIESIHGKVFKHGQNFSHWLNLALQQSFGSKEVVAIGNDAAAILTELTRAAYRPNTVYLASYKEGHLPLTKGRASAQTKLYICTHGTCNLPTNDAKTALELWMN